MNNTKKKLSIRAYIQWMSYRTSKTKNDAYHFYLIVVVKETNFFSISMCYFWFWFCCCSHNDIACDRMSIEETGQTENIIGPLFLNFYWINNRNGFPSRMWCSLVLLRWTRYQLEIHNDQNDGVMWTNAIQHIGKRMISQRNQIIARIECDFRETIKQTTKQSNQKIKYVRI